jgi:hypothetical protein
VKTSQSQSSLGFLRYRNIRCAGPPMLETLWFTPTTAHTTFPPPRVVQLGFPTVVSPNRPNPSHVVPLHSVSQSALSVTPKGSAQQLACRQVCATAFGSRALGRSHICSAKGMGTKRRTVGNRFTTGIKDCELNLQVPCTSVTWVAMAPSLGS